MRFVGDAAVHRRATCVRRGRRVCAWRQAARRYFVDASNVARAQRAGARRAAANGHPRSGGRRESKAPHCWLRGYLQYVGRAEAHPCLDEEDEQVV